VAGRLRTSLENAEAAKTEVKQVLAQSPQQYGLAHVRWTLADIGQVIPWLQQKTIPGVWQILHRLGFSYQQTAAFIRSPDPFFRMKVRTMMQAFEQAVFQPERAAILFQDELSYYRTPSLAPAWGETGQQPLVAKAPGTDKLTRIGAVLDGFTGQLLFQQGDKFGIQQMRTLYQTIRDHYPQRTVYVVQDNCPSVHKHPTVLALAEQLDITPVFLPTYASWLNPIERLWRLLKSEVLHNHLWPANVLHLRSAVDAFLAHFLEPSDFLLHYVGLLPD